MRTQLYFGTVLVFLIAGQVVADVPDSPRVAIAKNGAHIPYAEMKPDDLGPKAVKYDTTGMRYISSVPPTGVHPRMLHSPEDREELCRIYMETPHGRTLWRMLCGWTDKLKGKISQGQDFPTHPDGRLMAAYNRGGWTQPAEQYRRILDGDLTGYTAGMNDHILGSMAMEAYRCWIENDQAAAAELCRALENIADHLQGIVKPGDQPGVIGAYHMGCCYDYAFNFMTPEQREKVRELIAVVSLHKTHYGTFLESDATTGNGTEDVRVFREVRGRSGGEG